MKANRRNFFEFKERDAKELNTEAIKAVLTYMTKAYKELPSKYIPIFLSFYDEFQTREKAFKNMSKSEVTAHLDEVENWHREQQLSIK